MSVLVARPNWNWEILNDLKMAGTFLWWPWGSHCATCSPEWLSRNYGIFSFRLLVCPLHWSPFSDREINQKLIKIWPSDSSYGCVSCCLLGGVGGGIFQSRISRPLACQTLETHCEGCGGLLPGVIVRRWCPEKQLFHTPWGILSLDIYEWIQLKSGSFEEIIYSLCIIYMQIEI